jgi:hypothetical protein
MDRGFGDVFWLRWMHANVEQSGYPGEVPTKA